MIRRGMRLRAMLSFSKRNEEIGPPLDLLGAWYRADDAGTSNGQSVSSWPDRTGNGNDLSLSQGTIAGVWRLSPTGFGGKPAVEFAGTTQLEKNLPPSFQPGSHATTTYTVFQYDFASPPVSIWGFGSAPVGTQLQLIHQMYGNPRAAVFMSVNNEFVTYDGTDGMPKIMSFSVPTGAAFSAADVRFDGQVANPLYTLGSFNIPAPVQKVFVGGYDTPNFTGYIAEILYYSKQHNADERAATLAYLSARYGISVA